MADDLFEFVRSVFAPEVLTVAPRELVSPLDLSDRSKMYLSTVGLPACDVGFGMEFNHVARLPTLSDLYPERRTSLDGSWEWARFVSLKYDAGIYIDLEDSGTMWHIDLFGDGDALFVNSTVELLGYFVAECNHADWKAAPVAQWRQMLVAVEQRLRAKDAAAFDESGFWPLALEDARLYL